MLPTDAERQTFARDLRLSLARETLAQAIYAARATAFALNPYPSWRSLTTQTQERYREVADATLAMVEPQPLGLPPVQFATGLRPVTGGRIIGSIGDGAA